MQKPKLYTVIYKNSNGESMFFETNDEHTAEMKAIKTNGQSWIDTRYKARLRLYNYLQRKLMYS